VSLCCAAATSQRAGAWGEVGSDVIGVREGAQLCRPGIRDPSYQPAAAAGSRDVLSTRLSVPLRTLFSLAFSSCRLGEPDGLTASQPASQLISHGINSDYCWAPPNDHVLRTSYDGLTLSKHNLSPLPNSTLILPAHSSTAEFTCILFFFLESLFKRTLLTLLQLRSFSKLPRPPPARIRCSSRDDILYWTCA
jgi:hypothetical protein